MNTDNDRIESKIESAPEAINAPESTFSPCLLTYSASCGWIIFFIDSTNEVIPAYKTIAATIIELKYSILP